MPATANAASGSSTRLARVDFQVALLLTAVALCLRLPGLFSDFWLDEIWTFELTQRLHSPLQIFTDIRHSNNHHLNTLIYYVLGDQKHWSTYRLHSLLAGVGSVILACSIARRIGRLEALLAGLLTTSSYLLIHFSSEGRGYSLAIFSALASYLALQHFSDRANWRTAAVFWLCACVGILSHPFYLQAFAALSLWFPFHLAQRRDRKSVTTRRLFQIFAPPCVFFACLYFLDLRHAELGAGPDFAPLDVVLKAASYAGGGPASGPLAVGAALLTTSLFLAGIIWMRQDGRTEWSFFLLCVFLFPGFLLYLMRSHVVFVRYFLLSVTFGLLAASFVLAHLWRRNGIPRLAACLCVALYLLGNATNLVAFYRDGRGHYIQALQFIATHSQQQRPIVAGDQDFRNGTVIRYYNRFLPPADQVLYVQRYRPHEWFLFHRLGELKNEFPPAMERYGARYRLEKIFPYSDLSGWHWILYHKESL